VAAVRGAEALTPHLVRVVVGGPELEGLDPGLPAASVRLLLPPPGAAELVLPSWNGNEFLQADGTRPTIRTVTPRHLDPDALELTVEVVLHDSGPLSRWARTATAGDPVAVSGTGRGYTIDPDARSFLLAGDESAIPAISQLLEALPEGARVDAVIEVAHPDARLDLPSRASSSVRWVDLPAGAAPGEALVEAVTSAAIDPGAHVWVAGEAAAVQRIRKHLFDQRGLARSAAVVRGYWKRGRSAEPGDA
jgi:NADPH-dependent ferric siderophore reductase